MAKGRKKMTLRFSVRQTRHNIQSERWFLGAMLSAATCFIPAILAGLVASTAGEELKVMECFWGRGTICTRHKMLEKDW